LLALDSLALVGSACDDVLVAAISLELALGAIVGLAIVGLVAVWLIPKWQARRWRDAGVDPAKLAELELSARGTLVQLVGGLALILTFAATWAQLDDSRRASEKTLELAAQQQHSERFSRAIEQLGSPSRVSRVAAMAGLAAVVRGPVPADREPALQVVLAYLRTAHRPPASGVTMNLGFPPRDCLRPPARPTLPKPDMQAAMAIIIAHAELNERLHDLSNLDFTALDADSVDFSGAHLNGARLNEANLNEARFANAELVDSRFYRACLRGTSFRNVSAWGVVFIGSDLSEADFSQADLSRGNLQWSGLERASFISADLRAANLEGAALRGASLDSADLRGADLRRTGVTESQLSSARTDGCTRLPWRPRVSAGGCAFPGSIG
jgi:uncharacterized protein YjbI with pentapeptide repeats